MRSRGFPMDWLGWLKEAAPIAAVLGVGAWAGRLQQWQNDHEKAEYTRLKERAEREIKDPPLTLSDCRSHAELRDRIIALKFDHGEQQFKEIKDMIAANNKASTERHDQIMRFLAEMNKS